VSQFEVEEPILNSPYDEPTRHFRFSDDGITDEIVESRRVSSYFMPIPASNVAIVCPSCGPSRIGYRTTGDEKQRICKKCGSEI